MEIIIRGSILNIVESNGTGRDSENVLLDIELQVTGFTVLCTNQETLNKSAVKQQTFTVTADY